MPRVPEGFHVDTVGSTGDSVGLTKEEVLEERRAKREVEDGRKRLRVQATRPPFEIALKECGLYDECAALTRTAGVNILEIACDRGSQRIQNARRAVIKYLKHEKQWSSTDIGRLLGRDHTSILAALK